MDELFDIVAGKLVIHPTALAIPEVYKLWKIDKEHAIKVFSYIVFKHKYNSPYVLNTPAEELDTLLKNKFLTKDYKFTKEELECEAEISSFNNNLNTRLLQALRQKLWDEERYFRESAGSELTLDDINKLNKGVGELKKTIETIDTLEKAVRAGEINRKKVKGDKVINPYELPK